LCLISRHARDCSSREEQSQALRLGPFPNGFIGKISGPLRAGFFVPNDSLTHAVIHRRTTMYSEIEFDPRLGVWRTHAAVQCEKTGRWVETWATARAFSKPDLAAFLRKIIHMTSQDWEISWLPADCEDEAWYC
jgi:hypothetical protein